MATVLLVIHLFIAAALVGVVLVQRSEGGALGIGGGGGGGGFMSGRGTANLLTRITAALAGLFFMTSIGLSLIAQHGSRASSPLSLPATKSGPATGAKDAPAPAPNTGGGGVLDSLQKGRQALPPTPKQ